MKVSTFFLGRKKLTRVVILDFNSILCKRDILHVEEVRASINHDPDVFTRNGGKVNKDVYEFIHLQPYPVTFHIMVESSYNSIAEIARECTDENYNLKINSALVVEEGLYKIPLIEDVSEIMTVPKPDILVLDDSQAIVDKALYLGFKAYTLKDITPEE